MYLLNPMVLTQILCRQANLHSTMYLLNLKTQESGYALPHDLHSTMYLLNPSRHTSEDCY